MSELKHKTVEELKVEKSNTEKYIATLSAQLAGQEQRLIWIDHYLFEKTPKEMTFEEIERKLGHKVIIK